MCPCFPTERGIRRSEFVRLHAWLVTMRRQATRALLKGALAEVGDPNPYAGRSLVHAKCWSRGYARNLRVRIDTGSAMAPYLEGRKGITAFNRGAMDRDEKVAGCSRRLRKTSTAE